MIFYYIFGYIANTTRRKIYSTFLDITSPLNLCFVADNLRLQKLTAGDVSQCKYNSLQKNVLYISLAARRKNLYI